MSTAAIILAAGRSTRMKSRLPKVLHEICGQPMLSYVLQACYEAGCERLIVVVGHGKEKVIAQFGHDKRIHWVEQTEQLGTGHAVRMCAAALRKHRGDVFVLAGDGPLIRGQSLTALLEVHREERAAASLATAILDDPSGYGRVVRDGGGDFVRVVEQADATAEQREIREVFPNCYCCKADELLRVLPRLRNENKKKEYSLAGIFPILRDAGEKVVAIQAVMAEDMPTINTRQQQAEVDEVMQGRIQRRLLDCGVTIVSRGNTYVEAGTLIGAETVLRPFTFIGRDSSVGPSCMIGPFALIPRQSIVPAGTTVVGNISVQTALLAETGSIEP